jgi:hypothetical protein
MDYARGEGNDFGTIDRVMTGSSSMALIASRLRKVTNC